MKNKNKKEFLKFMAVLSVTFDKEITEMLSEIYWNVLKEMDIKSFIYACSMAVKTLKFFPKPIELLEIINGSPQDKSLMALLKVEKAISNHGYYYSVEFDDPLIHLTVENMGGWMQICCITIDDWKYRKQEFINIYNSLSKRPVSENIPKLTGFFEQDNRDRGYLSDIPKTILIDNGGNEKPKMIKR